MDRDFVKIVSHFQLCDLFQLFKNLPNELIVYIFQYLSIKDLYTISNVCKKWNLLIKQNMFRNEFIWDKNLKSNGLKIIKEGYSIERELCTKGLWHMTLGNNYFINGCHFWHIIIDEIDIDDTNKWKICIGISNELINGNNIDNDSWAGSNSISYGIELGSCQLIMGRKKKSTRILTHCGNIFLIKKGDIISLFLNINKKTLDFYYNKKILYKNISNIKGNLFYPIISISGNHKISLIKNGEY